MMRASQVCVTHCGVAMGLWLGQDSHPYTGPSSLMASGLVNSSASAPSPNQRILVLNPVVSEKEPDSFQMSQDFMIPETPEVKAYEALNSFVIREPVFLLAVTQMAQEALEPPRGTRGLGGGRVLWLAVFPLKETRLLVPLLLHALLNGLVLGQNHQGQEHIHSSNVDWLNFSEPCRTSHWFDSFLLSKRILLLLCDHNTGPDGCI